MPGEARVLFENPDGSIGGGLGAPLVPVNTEGVLSNMGHYVQLSRNRADELFTFTGGGASATTALDKSGRVVLATITDATGATWVYQIVPALIHGSNEFLFLGVLSESTPGGGGSEPPITPPTTTPPTFDVASAVQESGATTGSWAHQIPTGANTAIAVLGTFWTDTPPAAPPVISCGGEPLITVVSVTEPSTPFWVAGYALLNPPSDWQSLAWDMTPTKADNGLVRLQSLTYTGVTAIGDSAVNVGNGPVVDVAASMVAGDLGLCVIGFGGAPVATPDNPTSTERGVFYLGASAPGLESQEGAGDPVPQSFGLDLSPGVPWAAAFMGLIGVPT